MKIGILGSGPVAQALGTGFIKYGDEVMLGTRDLQKLGPWQKATGGKTGSFQDAAAFGEILVLAVKGSQANSALNLAGAWNLAGKTLIDTTNPIADAPAVHGVLQFYTSINDSQMEKLQRAYPDVNFVKAFNSVGARLMVNPVFGGEKPTMFICGNNPVSKDQVTEILEKFGWDVYDLGQAEAARAIEPLCMLWCIPGMARNEWNHAFRFLR